MPTPVPEYMRIRTHIINLISSSDGSNLQVPPENELCRLFGVTRPTVRNAIKGLVDDGWLMARRGIGTFIKPEMIEPNILGSPTIGFFGRDGHIVKSPYSANVIRMVEANGMNFEPLYIPNSDDPQRLVEMVRAGIDAVLWVDPAPACRKYLEALKASGLPLLVISREKVPFDTILMPDNLKAGRFIAEALFAKGHSRFVYVHNGPTDNGRLAPNSWLDACCRRMKKLSGEAVMPQERFVFLKDFPKYAKARRLRPEIFSAIYAVAAIVPQIMRVLAQEGLSVPRDVSFLSYEEPESHFFNGVAPEFIDVFSGMRRAFYDWSQKRIVHRDCSGGFQVQLEYTLKGGETVRDIRQRQ